VIGHNEVNEVHGLSMGYENYDNYEIWLWVMGIMIGRD
jgi:hypothetical protein